MAKLKAVAFFAVIAVVGMTTFGPGVGAEQETIEQYHSNSCSTIQELKDNNTNLPEITEENKLLVNETSDVRLFCSDVDYTKRNNEGIPEKFYLDYAYIIGTIEE